MSGFLGELFADDLTLDEILNLPRFVEEELNRVENDTIPKEDASPENGKISKNSSHDKDQPGNIDQTDGEDPVALISERVEEAVHPVIIVLNNDSQNIVPDDGKNTLHV